VDLCEELEALLLLELAGLVFVVLAEQLVEVEIARVNVLV